MEREGGDRRGCLQAEGEEKGRRDEKRGKGQEVGRESNGGKEKRLRSHRKKTAEGAAEDCKGREVKEGGENLYSHFGNQFGVSSRKWESVYRKIQQFHS